MTATTRRRGVKPPTVYCTVARVGHWCSLDVKIRTVEFHGPKRFDTAQHVWFSLIGPQGGTVQMGYFPLSQPNPAEPAVLNEETEERFPDLDTAIRHYADQLLIVTPMPGKRVNRPPRHDLYFGNVGKAF